MCLEYEISRQEKKKRFEMPTDDCWWTVEELSHYLKVTNDTIYKWIETKNLPAKRLGKKWLFKKEEIDAWMQGNAYIPQSEKE